MTAEGIVNLVLKPVCFVSCGVLLSPEMTADLPSTSVQHRWMAEPIRAVIFPTNIFLTNRKGFPVLSKVSKSCNHAMRCWDPPINQELFRDLV